MGIDLGTTYSVVAVCQSGVVSVVNARSASLLSPLLSRLSQLDGAPTVPSVVAYAVPPDGRTVVGAAAAALRSARPRATVHDAKRLIGLPAEHPQAQAEAAHLPYPVVAGAAGEALLQLEGLPTPVSPMQVATQLLLALKRAAERSRPFASALGFAFGSATVSVPVAFSRTQRAATLAAGRAAGFRLVRLLEEPVAAAIAYGLHDGGGERTVLVYDMGGGTLDCAVLRLERASRTFLVMATAGEAHLGGEDFDRALAVRFRSVFCSIPCSDASAGVGAPARACAAA